MDLKRKAYSMFSAANKKFVEQFGWPIKDTTISKLTDYLYVPKDSSSLAVTRILFGLAMLFDIPDERGGAILDRRWGDPRTCHFPLFPFLNAVPMPYMAIVYACLWLGALGIMLGYKYRISAPIFTVCYWYLLLVEKSYWNNHSYLFGLVGLLLACTEAHCYWSVDAYLDPSLSKPTVPYWNYFVLKYQFFILYFMAGVKKGTAEWLTGYSVPHLSEHWVFSPFKLFLSREQTDFLVVHCFIFVFDLTVAAWMMWGKSRNWAMLFCALFHLMNSRLFRIGMFPWVCLATMPLYYPFDWPKSFVNLCKAYASKKIKDICKRLRLCQTEHGCYSKVNNSERESIKEQSIDKIIQNLKGNNTCAKPNDNIGKEEKSKGDFGEKENKPEESKERGMKDQKYKKMTTFLIMFHVFSQLFLPYSHFITKGYNNWTEGLYGYSWDMMVHTWDAHSITVKVVDNERNSEMFIQPYIYTPNDRWTRHGDMVFQYAKCLKEHLLEEHYRGNRYRPVISNNISIYVDVWYSMNGRFAQRMFDPKVDILKTDWHPFTRIPFLMPLLDEALAWRSILEEMKAEVRSWNNYSDVIFMADFPGYELEQFIPLELFNVTLTILEGKVIYETEVTKQQNGQSWRMTTRDQTKVDSGSFHKIVNIGDKPAFYMYTFCNSTERDLKGKLENPEPKLPIGKELMRRFKSMVTFGNLVVDNIFQAIFRMSECQ